jgi:hypothetical protein
MMTTATLIQAGLSLVLVICLILITAKLWQWWQDYRQKLPVTNAGSTPPISIGDQITTLQIVRTQAIDFKRKLVLIRRGNVLHLLLCGEGRDIVIETGIPYQDADDTNHN